MKWSIIFYRGGVNLWNELRNNTSCPRTVPQSITQQMCRYSFFKQHVIGIIENFCLLYQRCHFAKFTQTTVPTQAHANQPNWHHQLLVLFQWHQSSHNFQNLKQFSCKTCKATTYYTPNKLHQLQLTDQLASAFHHDVSNRPTCIMVQS